MALLTLAEAKTALNITVTTYDTELQDYIDGAIAAVEFICGPTASTSQTDVLRPAGGNLLLTKTPVLTLTSITGDYVGARTITDFRVNTASGVVRTIATVQLLRDDWYTVIYTYGRTSIPAALKQAAKIILKHQWATQRGPSARAQASDAPPGDANRTVIPGLAYAIPNSALQMMAPYDRGPASG